MFKYLANITSFCLVFRTQQNIHPTSHYSLEENFLFFFPGPYGTFLLNECSGDADCAVVVYNKHPGVVRGPGQVVLFSVWFITSIFYVYSFS